MPRSLRIALVSCYLVGSLVVQPARGDTTQPLRGIGADLAAARLLEQAEHADAGSDRLETELSELEVREMQARQTLRSRVRALYRITRAGMAPIAGGFDAVRRHVARIKRMTLLVRGDLNALQALETRVRGLRAQASALAAARANAASQPQLSAAARGDAADESLTATPRQLSVRPLPAAIATPTRAASGNGFYGIRFSDDATDTSFEAKRGKLAAPIGGNVRVVDARRAESSGDGVEFQAPAGTSVRAAAAGRVAFADRYGSYGRLVILDHGASYYTAYGGLGTLDVAVGDDVSAYARLGTIGGGGLPALYFEVRKGAHTLPARDWLGM